MLVTVRGWKVNRQWFKTMTSSRDEQIAREDLSELTVQVKFGSQRKWCVNLTLTENLTFLWHWGGHQKVEGQEGDQRPLAEGLL